MSTISQTEAKDFSSAPEPSDNLAGGYLELPPCTIEDVDKALFNLFDKDLPLLYTHRNDTRRVPIIFATGERFALLARKQPLRDRSKALILPIISIMRSGLTFGSEVAMATAPDIRHVIKRQLNKEDPYYQRLINKIGLQNSDDLVSLNAFSDPVGQVGSEPGRIATRRPGSGNTDENKIHTGNLLDPDLGNNLYEIYEMPPPRYFMATYDITIWTQYTQEMNNLLAVLATESHFKAVTSYRIETEKGYYFVAYFDNSISPQNNFDNFSEEERIVRASFTVKVPGYFLGSTYTSAPNKIKRYISSPQLSFDVQIGDDPNTSKLGIPSGDPNSYVLSDMLTEEDSLPGQFMGESSLITNVLDANPTIGGYSKPQSALGPPATKVIVSPFSGKGASASINVTKTATTKQGETVYREIV